MMFTAFQMFTAFIMPQIFLTFFCSYYSLFPLCSRCVLLIRLLISLNLCSAISSLLLIQPNTLLSLELLLTEYSLESDSSKIYIKFSSFQISSF